MSEADLLVHAQEVLGVEFVDLSLLHSALTHASLADNRLQSNERMEFLGDSILGVIICEELYRRFDGWLEGDLTKVKSAVVSRRTCAEISDGMGLTDLLRLGKGVGTHDRLPVSLRAAVFEAVVGAIFLDQGYDAAKRFVLKHTSSEIDKSAKSEDQENYKSTLQQRAQQSLSATPRYETMDEKGPDHSKCFEVCVVIGHERFPSAWGPSKKAAEQEAARRTLADLRASGRIDGGSGSTT